MQADRADGEGLGHRYRPACRASSRARAFRCRRSAIWSAAQISFNRLLIALYKVKVEVDPAEVDKQYQEFANDPRLKPVTIYEILEITLPVDKTSMRWRSSSYGARRRGEQFSRATRAATARARRRAASTMSGSARSSRRTAQASARQLKAALDKAGPGSLVGPRPHRDGIQLIGFCGK